MDAVKNLSGDDEAAVSPSVSVIVPFYNNEAHIADCVEALLTQEGVEGRMEIIFIDNGSTDGSAEVVGQYEGIVMLTESIQGAYAARNSGLERVSAPIVAFTDADCRVDRDWVRSIQVGMADASIAMLVGSIRYPREASRSLRFLGAYENAKVEYVLERGKASQRFAHANNMAVRASLFDELGPFQEWKRASDSEFVHRVGVERPDLRIRYRPEMRVTHNEFVSSRERMSRLRLYSQTNARISDFEELGVAQRLGILWRLLTGPRVD